MQNSIFEWAKEKYAEVGVDVELALGRLSAVSISLQCWQGDDVTGFESTGEALGGGLAVTGAYPGKARTPDELKSDASQALQWIPGTHRFNLHASYGEFRGQPVDRDAISIEHFSSWVDWAKELGIGLDFNPTFFSHPRAADGWTLAAKDKGIREFWIEHGKRCRDIGSEFGKRLGTTCCTNFWIPDGFKDTPVDRYGPRKRLIQSLDAIFNEPIDEKYNVDSVEGKLFGIGSESYVAGSHEFYWSYALTRGKLLCLDSGHFHPTESIADKISAALAYMPGLMLHVSRGVRWDSDHIVTWNDDLQAITREVVRNEVLDRVRLGLDFFDASVNRVAAWVIGARSLLKALLAALLEPDKIREAEISGDLTQRLVLQERMKLAPLGVVWDEFCQRQQTPSEAEWWQACQDYERNVLLKRQ